MTCDRNMWTGWRRRFADGRRRARPGSTNRTRRPNSFLQWCYAMRPCARSEEHTSELQSLMRISYAVFCLKKKKKSNKTPNKNNNKRTHQISSEHDIQSISERLLRTVS